MRIVGIAAAALCCVVGSASDPVEARGGRGKSIGSVGRAAIAVPVPRVAREARDTPDGSPPGRQARTPPGAFNGVYSRRDGGGAAVPVGSTAASAEGAIPASSPMPVVQAVQQQPAARSASHEDAPPPSRVVRPAFTVQAAATDRSYAVKPCRSKQAGDLFCALH
jgi:hypothetical protein